MININGPVTTFFLSGPRLLRRWTTSRREDHWGWSSETEFCSQTLRDYVRTYGFLIQSLKLPLTEPRSVSSVFVCLSPAVREPRKSSGVMRGGIVPIDAAVASLGVGRDCYDEWSEYFGESSVLASMPLCRLVANRWTSNKSGKRVRAAKRVAGESTVSRLRGPTFEYRNFQRRGSRFSDVFNEFDCSESRDLGF